MERWTLPAVEVRKIERQDPLENGIWRGFAVGAALVYGSCFSPLNTEALCGAGSDSAGLGYVGLLVHGLPYVALGAVAGGLVDGFTHTTLYEAPGARHGGIWVDVSFTDRISLLFGAQGTHVDVSSLVGFREGSVWDASIGLGGLRIISGLRIGL